VQVLNSSAALACFVLLPSSAASRILRKIAEGDTSNLGDTTALDSAGTVEALVAAVKAMRAEAAAAKKAPAKK
jgi:hypothetical protein